MLDEIDCISIERGSSSGEGADGEMSRITISLMQELDKISNQAIIIAATNRLDRIDKALIRRFSKVHEVKKLTDAELETLKNNYLMDIGIELSEPVSMEVKNQSEMITNINAMIEKEIENSMINNPELEYQLNLEMFGTPKLSSNF
jgi:AAA+ superfamily predicted ATPase